MNSHRLRFVLAAVCLVALIGCACGQTRPFGVMTYNVENLFDTCHDAGFDDYEFLPMASDSGTPAAIAPNSLAWPVSSPQPAGPSPWRSWDFVRWKTTPWSTTSATARVWPGWAMILS